MKNSSIQLCKDVKKLSKPWHICALGCPYAISHWHVAAVTKMWLALYIVEVLSIQPELQEISK